MTSLNSNDMTDLSIWLKLFEQLRSAPECPEDELTIEMKQTRISVLLLSRNHVIKRNRRGASFALDRS